MFRKLFGMALILAAASQFASAGIPASVPELDPATGISAFVLLSGAVLIIRARRHKG
jgi:hypothetical protein